MKTLTMIFGLLLATTALSTTVSANTEPPTELKTPLSTTIGTNPDNRYIILFNHQTNNKAFALNQAHQLINDIGGKTIHSLPSIKGMAAQLTKQQVAQLKANPQVALIEKDPLRHFQTEAKPYGISQIQADLLSDSNTGNITVCIADTGIDLDHQDLPGASNITGEVSNTLTVEMDIGQWHDDSYGHGTHMAGTIAAIGGNGLGTVGVNPGGNFKLHRYTAKY